MWPRLSTYSHALPAWDCTQGSQCTKGPHGAERGNIGCTGPNSRKVNQRQLHHGKVILGIQKHDWLMQQSTFDAPFLSYCKEQASLPSWFDTHMNVVGKELLQCERITDSYIYIFTQNRNIHLKNIMRTGNLKP